MACPTSHVNLEKRKKEVESGEERRKVRGNGEGREGPWKLESEHGRERGLTEGHTYSLVRSRVCRGDVFVIPAGHPVVAVASRDNLQILCFGINAENNMKVFLAGKNNVLKQMEKEAKELAFNTPATEVDRLLNAQPESVFFAGPGES